MLLIGIDVGGTNTDGVLLDPSKFSHPLKGVLNFHKCVTTGDVSSGIESVIEHLFDSTPSLKQDVAAVTIGTTHFINAVIEQDKARLDPVGVIRLCGPYGIGTPPFSNFPLGLKNIIECYNANVDGGHHIDTEEIQPLDEKAIINHAKTMKQMGIKCVAINGIFAAINQDHEIRAAQLVKLILPEANVVMSHQVSGLGFLERENAAILNASVMSFAAKVIHSFINSTRRLQLHCPILLTQNDGTVLTCQEAFATPIRTFSSGATNSMRGAAFLCSDDKDVVGKNIIVVDIGGTTSDVGMLLPSGFPRQMSSYSIVGGVKMNFSMPQVESIGLGGGSIIRERNGGITIGPDSVGADIITKSLIFGGDTVTTTDITVSVNADKDKKFTDANIENVKGKFPESYVQEYDKTLKKMLEAVLDRMRINPDPLPVLLVGGGSFISPSHLEGASKVIRPPYYQVANAIGAALGKLSFVLQRLEKIEGLDQKEEIIADMKALAINEIVKKGALKLTISVVDLSYDPIPYVDKTYSFEIKVVGDVDYNRIAQAFAKFEVNDLVTEDTIMAKDPSKEAKVLTVPQDHLTYKPFINDKKEWIISPTDLDYISVGSYILGCGGGGHPYPLYLEIQNLLKKGDVVRVIDLKDAPTNATFVPVACAGSPTVTNEQLHGVEFVDAVEAAIDYYKKKPFGVIPTEIGGSNGLAGLVAGSSSKLDLPCVDCDLMGRAYPTLSQIVPCIYEDGLFMTLTSVSDGNGNKFVITGAQSDVYVEKMVRAALSEVGASVGVATNYMTTEDLQKSSIHNSISNCWRIGRSIYITRQKHEFDKLPQRILESLGGERIGKTLFQGKIVGVEKKLFKGHVYGEVTVENEREEKLIIPFKNENLVANLQVKGEEPRVVASVPDLISVCYADSGEAVGTPDYRYGLMVFVLVFAPDPCWRTDKGLLIGGPKGFGQQFESIEYVPIGDSIKPKSVIEEYSK